MVGEKIREALRERNRSITWLAKQLGIHRTTVHRKLSGELEWTISEANRIAKALGLSKSEANNIFFSEYVA